MTEATESPLRMDNELPICESIPINEKWFTAREPRPHFGWSIIAAVPFATRDCEPFQQMLRIIREDLPAGAYSQHPLASLHMTIADGFKHISYNQQIQRWPRTFSNELSFQAAMRKALDLLENAQLPKVPPVRMSYDALSSPEHGLFVRFCPADNELSESLSEFRHAIYDTLDMPIQDIDEYQFHVTLGYRLAKPGTVDKQTIGKCWEDISELAQNMEEITLENPAFCAFHDMFSFVPLYYF